MHHTSNGVSYACRNIETPMNCAPEEDEPVIRSSSGSSETMSLAEAASFMRIGIDALRSLIYEGLVPALSLNQKHWVLLRSDLVEFIRHTAHQQQMGRRSLAEESRWATLPAKPAVRARGRPRNRIPDQ